MAKEQKTHINPLCSDCLIYRKFGKDCWVYWDNKKFCTMKVITKAEWDEQKKITKK